LIKESLVSAILFILKIIIKEADKGIFHLVNSRGLIAEAPYPLYVGGEIALSLTAAQYWNKVSGLYGTQTANNNLKEALFRAYRPIHPNTSFVLDR
jgi:hypothetical protein